MKHKRKFKDASTPLENLALSLTYFAICLVLGVTALIQLTQ